MLRGWAGLRLCFFVVVALSIVPDVRAEFDAGLSPVSVTVAGHRFPYRIFFYPALPGETVPIRLEQESGANLTLTDVTVGVSVQKIPGGFEWQAPADPGHYSLLLTDGQTTVLNLHLFVMVPSDSVEGEYLKGYRIGNYPKTPLRGHDIYKRPRGFIEVTPDIANVKISPHFTLGEFLAKQHSGWPKFVVLRPKLLLKLEYILREMNDKGWNVSSLHIMSGYRTPFYNKQIGNVPYSRHVYGGAADIFIDVNPRDGRMDDLDRDGRITKGDAQTLASFIAGLASKNEYQSMIGGLASYGSTAAHGPFVHIDVRGWRARW